MLDMIAKNKIREAVLKNAALSIYKDKIPFSISMWLMQRVSPSELLTLHLTVQQGWGQNMQIVNKLTNCTSK